MRVAGALAALALIAVPASALAVAQPAKPVDLARYAGRWYEIAHTANRHEADCVSATADYRDDGGRISVTETCRTTAGRRKSYRPSVRILDPGTNAKLRLTFFVLINKDYWVLDHADDYSWALVGSPTGKNFWVFARTPELPEPLKAEIVARAKSLGYDTSRIVYDKP